MEDLFKSCGQQHLSHGMPVVEKLVLVSLPKVQINDLHRCFVAGTAPFHQFLGRFEVATQYVFCIGDNYTKAAAMTENAMNFPRNSFTILEREMLENVFAEDTIEWLIWERKRPAEIQKKVNALVPEPVHIHPVIVINAPWTGTKIQKHWFFSAGKKVRDSNLLAADRIPSANAKKVNVPARNRQEAMAKKQQKKLTPAHGS
jgi:hypothetical protein